jgi:hypothetical protein
MLRTLTQSTLISWASAHKSMRKSIPEVSLWRLHEWINKGNGPRPSHDVVYLILVLTRSAPAHETPASCISPEPNSLSRAEILMGKREKRRTARTLGRTALSQLFASNVSIKPRMRTRTDRPTNQSLNAVYLSARNVRFPIAVCVVGRGMLDARSWPLWGSGGTPQAHFVVCQRCILGALVDCNYHPGLTLDPSGTDWMTCSKSNIGRD